MIDKTHLALFITAASGLALIPGPGMLYILGRTLHGGRRDGIYSAVGTLIGGLVHVLAAALGVSAVLMTSAFAFAVVKYAGAAYLIYLGITMIRGRKMKMEVAERGEAPHNNFIQGVTTEVLNPKTALFFLSFIPQFADPLRGHLFFQILFLGMISLVLNTSADLIVVILAGAVTQRLKGNDEFVRAQRTTSGVGMIGLGAYLAISKLR